MTSLSPRFAVPLLTLFTLALIPVIIHTYFIAPKDDCANPAALAAIFQGDEIDDSEIGAEDENSVERDVLQMIRRKLKPRGANRVPLEFVVARTTNPIFLYTRPIRFLFKKFEADEQFLEWVGTGDQRLPVHFVVDDAQGVVRMVAYTFLYGSEAVARPFIAQIGSAGPQLMSGTRPLTLLLIGGEVPKRKFEVLVEDSKQWLLAARVYYAAVCSK